ncbi:hypothetical protein EVAR_68073_1 [Eumeta japonica]|uniref:Uncharacterized protein n=1 Tax=Eumeta variegata TaxID=151549 RepID=A0A4C1ZZN3_EUMVA|nr:hypothetical protein EVAR_68073_1 [Eumeta japonica]
MKFDEDGRLIDRPTAYHATKAETLSTGSGMADENAISGSTDRSLHAHGRSGGASHPPEQSHAERVAPLNVLNDVIPRDLCIETVEEFIQYSARGMYDIAEKSPHEFFQNIAPMQERSLSGRPLPREFLKTLPFPQG